VPATSDSEANRFIRVSPALKTEGHFAASHYRLDGVPKIDACEGKRASTLAHESRPPEIRIAAPLPFEQLLPPDPLAVAAVPNLEPTGGLNRQVANRQLTPGINGDSRGQ
jgi:hypothetical protein